MRKMKMKALPALALLAVALTAVVLAGCGSSPAKKDTPSNRISLDSEDKIVTLEHKGTALGKEDLPQWLSSYLDSGVPGVEKLPDYKDKYCIVADEMGTGNNTKVLQQLLTWVNNFNAQQQIGAQINTRVASVFKANENKVPDNEESRRKFSNAINTLISASYSGARKEGDWWVKQRVESKGQETEIRYTVYVLYSIPKKTLEDQIVTQVGKIKKENPGLDAAFDAVTATILERGLVWEQDE
jgi:outer membrane murein-binding lipoprotein Lpp/Holliday junction resolvase RusA-like endonuclease